MRRRYTGKFGEWEGYTGDFCVDCGGYPVEHYANGYDICTCCLWCPQINSYIPYDERYETIDD